MFGQRKTVDSVLGVFTKAIADLEQVEQEHTTLAESKIAESRRLASEAGSARVEADRAAAVREKLRAVVNA